MSASVGAVLPATIVFRTVSVPPLMRCRRRCRSRYCRRGCCSSPSACRCVVDAAAVAARCAIAGEGAVRHRQRAAVVVEMPPPCCCAVAGEGAVRHRQRAPCCRCRRRSWSRAVAGEGAVRHRQRAIVVRCRRRRLARVAGEGAVRHRQRAVVEDAAAVAGRALPCWMVRLLRLAVTPLFTTKTRHRIARRPRSPRPARRSRDRHARCQRQRPVLRVFVSVIVCPPVPLNDDRVTAAARVGERIPQFAGRVRPVWQSASVSIAPVSLVLPTV